jgi:peptidoglycan/LPS O-acetylase OafA/YrhL
MLHTRADMLMLGCALAVANEAPGFPSIARRVFGPAVLGGAALIVFVVTPLGDAFARGKYELLGGDLATGFAIVTLLAWIMSDGVSSRAGRALSHPAIVRLGIISYSFYLWQQLVLLPGGRAPLWQFPVDFGVVIVLAEASYRFVERPLLAHAASHAAPGIVDTPGGA